MSYTILIVDDEWQNLESMQKYFEFKGYGTFIAENGDKALETLRNENIDYVVLNIDMPGMTGDQVIETIKTDPEFKDKVDMPIALCTGVVDRNQLIESKSFNLVQGIESGKIPVFTKPVSSGDLLMQIEDTLQRNKEAGNEDISPNLPEMNNKENNEYKSLE